MSSSNNPSNDSGADPQLRSHRILERMIAAVNAFSNREIGLNDLVYNLEFQLKALTDAPFDSEFLKQLQHLIDKLDLVLADHGERRTPQARRIYVPKLEALLDRMIRGANRTSG